MRIIRTVAPTTYPITLDEVKTHLRLDGIDPDCLMADSDDLYLEALIQSATDYCESYQKLAYLTQTWELILEEMPYEITLPKGNLQSITSITYKTADGTVTAYTDYDYNLKTGKIFFNEYISDDLYNADPISITFVCGWTTADDVPARIKQAIKFLISHWYEVRTPIDDTRTAPQEIAFTLSALLNMDKRVSV